MGKCLCGNELAGYLCSHCGAEVCSECAGNNLDFGDNILCLKCWTELQRGRQRRKEIYNHFTYLQDAIEEALEQEKNPSACLIYEAWIKDIQRKIGILRLTSE